MKKINSNVLPAYLREIISKKLQRYITRNTNDIRTYQRRTDALISSFFTRAITEWNKTDNKNRNSSYSRSYLLKEFRPQPILLNSIQNTSGIKLGTRLRLRLNPLNEHNFNHNFHDFVSFFASAVYNLSQQHTSIYTTIIMIQLEEYHLMI